MATDYEKLGVFYLGRPWEAAKKAAVNEPLLHDFARPRRTRCASA